MTAVVAQIITLKNRNKQKSILKRKENRLQQLKINLAKQDNKSRQVLFPAFLLITSVKSGFWFVFITCIYMISCTVFLAHDWIIA